MQDFNANTSATGGWLTLTPDVEAQAYDDFIGDAISGITGLTRSLVRPMWELKPATQPDIGTDWCSFGLWEEKEDYSPAVTFKDDDGGDQVITWHRLDYLIAFYGPNAVYNARTFKTGLWVNQNLARFREYYTVVTDCGDITPLRELVNQRYLQRADVHLYLVRQSSRAAKVLSVLSAEADISADLPGINKEK